MQTVHIFRIRWVEKWLNSEWLNSQKNSAILNSAIYGMVKKGTQSPYKEASNQSLPNLIESHLLKYLTQCMEKVDKEDAREELYKYKKVEDLAALLDGEGESA